MKRQKFFFGSVPKEESPPPPEVLATPQREDGLPSSERYYASSDGHVSCILSPLDRGDSKRPATIFSDDNPPLPINLDPTNSLLQRYRSTPTGTPATRSLGDPFLDTASTPRAKPDDKDTTMTEPTPSRSAAAISAKLSSSPPKSSSEFFKVDGLSDLDDLDSLDDDDLDFALTQFTQKKPEQVEVKQESRQIKVEPLTSKDIKQELEQVKVEIDDTKLVKSQSKSSTSLSSSHKPVLTANVIKGKTADSLNQSTSTASIVMDDFNDSDLDSDLDTEFAELQARAKKPRPQTARYKLVTDHVMSQRTHKENALPLEIDYRRDDVFRGRIQEVTEEPSQIALIVEDSKSQQFQVALRGCWTRATPLVGDICHIVDASIEKDEFDMDVDMDFDYIVDDMKGDLLFILNPDTLVTCTAVAEAHQCTRNVVLKDKMKAPHGLGSIFALYGIIIHEIIQMCFGAVRYDAAFVDSCAETVTRSQMEAIMLAGETFDSILSNVKERLPPIVEWFKQYMRQKPVAVALENRTQKKRTVAISKVIDVEEEIWSPRYGLKGKIDATIEVTEGSNKFLVPLEVKTGKSTTIIPHRSQTALYTLMLHDRYSCPVNFGILYYSSNSETIVVPAVNDEIHNLLAIRNEVATYMREDTREMPDVIYDQGQCDRCYQKSECMLYYRLYDTYVKESQGEDGGSTANKARFMVETEHVTEKDSQFFNYWDALLTKEGADGAVFKREVWTMMSKDREKEGRCFSDLVIDKAEMAGGSFRYTFKNPDGAEIPYASVNLAVGDRVVISDESGHYCLAMGVMLGSSTEAVRCSLDRRLEFSLQKLPGFRPNDNQVFQSMLVDDSEGHVAPTNFRFRVDRDDFAFGLGVARNNLFSLFAKRLSAEESPQKIEQLRSWIVDLVPPAPVAGEPSVQLGGLNADQTNAVHHILNSRDYNLLLGMPGTGKTTTIAEIILELVKNGKTVLLSSFTHSAVDNILLKLKQHPRFDFDMLRLGRKSKIHPDIVEDYAAQNRTEYETVEEFNKLFLDPPVVGATSLGVGDWVLQKRHFDYCIVDEASQITLPFCLGPIRYADKFVLVGDHYQLTPIVKHPEAAGLRDSLFQILCDAHPEHVINLGIQYRMCADIMLLSNTLVYDGKLKCGNDRVANQSLVVPQLSKLRTLYADGLPSDDYLGHVLDPSRKVIFLNTDLVPAQETIAGDRVHNPTEALIVGQIVEALCLCGVEESQIGCISQYRAQLKLINKELALRSGIEVMTADKFQGRDKDCIIVSLVRSNNEQRVGDLLKDWRRLNVAFTRSRSKLIIIGSRATLESFDLLNEFLRLIDNNGWMYSLPKGCTGMYSVVKTGTSPRKKQKRVGLSQRLIDNKPVMKNIIEGL